MRKIYLFLLTLFCAVGASAQQITQLNDISNGKCYTIKAQTRGYLYYDGNVTTEKMRSSNHTDLNNDNPDENVVANQIAILRTENTFANCYYLYSVAAQKFLSYDGSNVTLWLSDTPYSWELTETTNNQTAYFTIKVPGSQQTYINVTNWNADNGCKVVGTPVDEGNRMVITEAVPFDEKNVMAAINTFEALFVNFSVNLDGEKWIQVGEKANFFEPTTSADDNSHWYIMQQVRNGLSPMYDNGAGNTMNRAASGFTPNNKQVSGNEKYLVRFIPHRSGNGYVMQFATGNYVREVTTTAYPTQEGWYLLYKINGENGHIGWNKTTDGTTYGQIVDNDGAGSTLSFWGSGQVTEVGGNPVNNNVWSLYPVTFQDDVPAEGLQAFIGEISTYYNANAGKPGYVTTNWVNNTLNTAIAGAESAVTSGDREQINAAYNNLKNLDTETNKEIALPIAGKFYRIQNESANAYLVSGTGTGKAQFAAAAGNAKNNIFYYDGTRLLSYDNGYYLSEKNYGGNPGNPFVNYTETLGEGAATTFAFAASPVYGKLLIKFSNGSRALYSAGAGNSDAAGSENTGQHYRFAVTEVEWLPVPMNTEAGYATLYSPVQLGLGDAGVDRVDVYTVSSTTSSKATLTKQTCVPAETGVILKYNSGIENGMVYLPVQPKTVDGVSSELSGTFAKTSVTDDAYVLSKPSDQVGLFKAQKSAGAWINNAFRAYLPAGTGNARFLTFDFDDNAETGINAIEIEEATPADAAIYDLSGRRVQSAKSGLYIINGKKVIK